MLINSLHSKLMMFMRLLCSACQKELGPTANQVSAEGKTCILNAALLLGRLAWLLKINGRFIADALQPIQGAVGNDSISDDQLFSAFEIADTNGDGLVTVTEATEALQALSLERVDEQTRRIAFLDPVPGDVGRSTSERARAAPARRGTAR